MTLRSLTAFLALVGLLLAGHRALAQVDTVESPMSVLHSLYAGLDPSLMPHGLLFQTAFPITPIADLRGDRAPADRHRVDNERFGRVLFALGSAVRAPNQPALFDLGYRDHYRPRALSEHVELTGVLAAGGHLRGAAFANGWLAPNADSTMLVQLPGMSAAAYLLDTVFAFAPTVGELGGPSVVWQFTDSLFYGNIPWPTQLQFDPGDGLGLRAVSFGDSLAVDYFGIDTARFELRFSAQGKTYRAYSWARVAPQQRPMNGGIPCEILDVPGTSIEVVWADPGCLEEFTNTIIVVDGIDPSPEQNVVFTHDELTGAYDKYTTFESSGTAVSALLQQKGYDFAFINFDDGGQSIESTAQILKAAIRYINQRKAAAGIVGDNIVIGHSMGGLTAKWALAEMAAAGEEHGVSKFFSFDSPFRGATIPLGLQLSLEYLLNLELRAGQNTVFLREMSPQFNAADVALNSQAARELLNFSVDVHSFIRVQFWNHSNARYVPYVDLASHAAFQTAFDNLPPLDVPHIALTDGSREADQENGTTDPPGTTIRPNERFFYLQIDQEGEVEGLGDDVSASDFSHNAEAFVFDAAYASTTKAKVRWLTIPWVRRGVGAGSNHADFGLPAFDLAPGSHANDGFPELIEAATDLPQGMDTNSVLRFTQYLDHFCFVPTSSALNLPLVITAPVNGCGPGINECITPDPDNLASRFLDETRNFEHVTFTPRIADAMLERIPELGTHEWSGTGVLPAVDRRYNFASAGSVRTPSEITGIRSVVGGGAFLINRSDRIRYIDDTNNPAATSTSYDVFLTGGSCGEAFADITLQSGAEFLVGEADRTATVTALPGTRVTVQAGGVLAVDRGSDFILRSAGPDGAGGIVVEAGGLINAVGPFWSPDGGGRIIADNGGVIRVKAGGQIRASSAGQLVAQDGGRIILEDGALVQLWDGNNPNSDGVIWIRQGGNLEILGSYTFTGSGYFHFSSGANVDGPGALHISRGDVTTSVPNKSLRRLVLGRSSLLTLDPQQGLVVEQCQVLANEATIYSSLGGVIKVNDVAWLNGAPSFITDAFGEVLVTNTDFINGRGAKIDCPNRMQMAPVTFDNCNFIDNLLGLQFESPNGDIVQARLPEMTNCAFSGGKVGVELLYFYGAIFEDCQFVEQEEYGAILGGAKGIRFFRCDIVGQNSTTFGGLVAGFDSHASFTAGSISDCEEGAVAESSGRIDFTKCAAVMNNQTGLYGSSGTFALGGMVIANNARAIKGNNVTLLRDFLPNGNPVQNTFDRSGGNYFIDVNYSSGNAIPALDLSFNGWLQDGQQIVIPDPSTWFCFRQNNGACQSAAVNLTPTIEGHGCGNDDTTPCEGDDCPGGGGGNPGPCGSPDKPCLTVDDPTAQLSVAPNPTSRGSVQVTHPTGGGTLLLIDVLGRTVTRVPLAEEAFNTTLDVGLATAGMYYVRLERPDGSQQAVPLVVQ